MGRCACRRRHRVAPGAGTSCDGQTSPKPPSSPASPPPRLYRTMSRDRWTSESSVPPGEMMYYPMYVVAVADFMNMSSAQPHQVLKSLGMVKCFDPQSGGASIFVSHQWCGRERADPQFRQLRTLQHVFEQMSLGMLQVGPDFYSTITFRMKKTVRPEHLMDAMTWYMWFDYFSVPQPKATVMETGRRLDLESDLGKAVASLSAYVASCELFLVLAPTIIHEENVVFQMGAQDYLLDGVALGSLSDEGDRPHVSFLVVNLLRHKLRRLLRAGRMREYRRLICARTAILQGIDCDGLSTLAPELATITEGEPSLEDVDTLMASNFLRSLGASLPNQPLDGSTPLLLASCVGDVSVIRGLLELRASFQCSEKRNDAEFVVHKGRQPLHWASRYGHLEAMELLISARADVNGRDALGGTPLHAATGVRKRGKAAVVRLLLEHRAEIDARNKLGNTPLDLCAVFSMREVAQCLLSEGAQHNSGSDGLGPAHCLGAFGSGVQLGRMLLEARASVNQAYHPRFGTALGMLSTVFYVSYKLGSRSLMSMMGYHLWGASPLAFAVMNGNLAEAQLMLQWRADPGQKNDRGATPQDLARIFGTFETESAWLFSSGDETLN
mmetsp:Transcript_120256/g.345704  ORF Transcript_120256/g.345704 Transcript_120256/m.345704 type:complete len:611 (+) Transcript_120256:88-1920(+)